MCAPGESKSLRKEIDALRGGATVKQVERGFGSHVINDRGHRQAVVLRGDAGKPFTVRLRR
jgi:hypothetical protein